MNQRLKSMNTKHNYIKLTKYEKIFLTKLSLKAEKNLNRSHHFKISVLKYLQENYNILKKSKQEEKNNKHILSVYCFGLGYVS